MTTININGTDYNLPEHQKQVRASWSIERRNKINQYQKEIHKLMEEHSITNAQAKQLYKQIKGEV